MPAALKRLPALTPAPPHFRAFWVDAFHRGIKSLAEIDRLIRDAQAAQVNALLVQVRRRGDAYYNRTSEPRSAELRRQPDFDPLATLIEQAHAATPALQVHAWLTALPIATASAPPPAPEHVYYLHGPAAQGDDLWLSVAADGMLAAEDTLALDPGHPAAAQYVVDVARNLVRNYDVDGIHFDRIRYAGPQFGYNPVSLARYLARAGATATPAPADPAWQAWRRDQVTGLMRQLYLEIIALKPGVIVSAATIPWGAGPTSEAAWQRGSAMTAVFQDWLSWLREGIVDLVIPMNYNREADARQRAWFDGWIEWEKHQRGDRHIVIGLGAFLNEVAETVSQARRALAPAASGQMAQGVAFYAYANTQQSGLSPDQLSRGLTMTDPQGATPLFAEPAQMPEMPWKTRPETGYLKGFVCYADGRPGDGLRVALGPAGRTLSVSGAGFYGAARLLPGTYDVTVLRDREVLAVELIDIEAGRAATLDITL